MGDYIRARSPEKKKERMCSIMDAADKLFLTHPYHEITMGRIANELGWSRSNLYKYAATQEEIFLALHNRKNKEYVDDLLRGLSGDSESLSEGVLSDEEFASKWAEVTAEHGDFLRYQDILISIIESNVGIEKLIEFKRSFVEITSPLFERIADCRGISESEAKDLYLQLLYQASGLYNHFNCAELTREAMERAGLDPIEGNFQDAFYRFIVRYL